jgi:hypothetical protein
MKKNILEMLEELQVALIEAEEEETAAMATKKPVTTGDEDEDEEDEKISDHTPDGKGHYTADDLREIIDYVRDLLKEENDEDDDDEEGNKKGGDDIGEIGLDLIYEYADLLPETVINQLVDDLKDMFEIEDTMLESIVTEGASFFNKAKKGPAALAARSKMREFYRKNKGKISARNAKWRASEIGQKVSGLHKKIYKGMGRVKGKRIVSPL